MILYPAFVMMSTIFTRCSFMSPLPDLGLNTNKSFFFIYLSSSAIADNFLSLWLTPDLPIGGSRYPRAPLAVHPDIQAEAAPSPEAAPVNHRVLSFLYQSDILYLLYCRIHSLADVCGFAVYFTVYTVAHSFNMRTFSSFMSDTYASMMLRLSTMWAPSFMYTT